ncbi:SDR family oxidoreductase [Bacillus sp. 165]|uniref:SDR family NAD(P)-dependent oxidoreductase n=1 Tax=Bacillus sp. 165 TaxID=1529117 RepID=UPI001ADC09D8|nr:SDR family oxidoreductase [Bacillus sp. 165]MBO9129170.1 SDR family oxidoreductase [Bacillus sp. 165]
MNYEDKTVLVTGAANGIGLAIARAYIEKGATVVLADKDQEEGQKAATELGEKAFFYLIDLKNVNEIVQMFHHLQYHHGNIDILINNAGVSKFCPLEDLTVEEWDGILHVNLRSFVFTSKEFYKLNKGTSYGRIINIASTRAFMSEPHSEAYGASKGGIVALTHALALSLGEENITVNCISPGWIQTSAYDELRIKDHVQHPSLRVGKPEDIARACLFLTDDYNDFINGENITIDGGMMKKMIYEE